MYCIQGKNIRPTILHSVLCVYFKTNLRIPVENEHGFLWRRKQISPQLNHSLQIWGTSLLLKWAIKRHGVVYLSPISENGQNKIHRLFYSSVAFGVSSDSAEIEQNSQQVVCFLDYLFLKSRYSSLLKILKQGKLMLVWLHFCLSLSSHNLSSQSLS